MTSHLDALELRLSNERVRFSLAKSASERHQRAVWIMQIEKEIANEKKFTASEVAMTDDELLAELGA